MIFRIELKKTAHEQLEALPLKLQARIKKHLHTLEEDPFRPRPRTDIKKIGSDPPLWRLRIGDYRAIYSIEGERVLVTMIIPRGEAERVYHLKNM